MAKQKKETTKSAKFAQGGSGHMFGPQAAGEQKPGDTAHDVGGSGGKFAQGGSGKMFGYSPSNTAQAGITSPR